MLREWLMRYPSMHTLARRVAGLARGGQGRYALLDPDAGKRAAQALRGAWRDDAIPPRQRALVDAQLNAYRSGRPNVAFDALVDVLRPLCQSQPGLRLLEVGCSSGYYSEVLAARGLEVTYTGCDYSEAFVTQARALYPALAFKHADATRLPYDDASMDVVISGCCLLHIPEYGQAIAETARVTKRWAVFHRTPVLHAAPTRYFTKQAYGVGTFEIHFSETELVRLFARNGLRIVDVVTLSVDWASGTSFASKTYLCEKS